ncbi:MAG: hypothetical protein ABI551_22120 [Polyangiaceae bacterium]
MRRFLGATSKPVGTILLAGIPATFAAYFLLRALLALGTRPEHASLLVFGYALGTLSFPYATLLYGHALAAALVGYVYLRVVEHEAGALKWSRRDLSLAGLASGLGFIVEYPTAIMLAPLLLFACSRAKRSATPARSPSWFIRAGLVVTAGALPWIALHALYTTWAFGSPFTLPYKYVNQPIFSSHMTGGVFGIGLPSWKATYGALLSPYRGLFFFSPLCAFVFAGMASWFTARRLPALARLTAVVLFVELWFATSYYAWDGGGAVGPRHIVPALALFIVPIGFFLPGARWRHAAFALATAASVVFVGMAVAVYIQTPIGDVFRSDPLYAIIVPALARGEIGLNWLDLRGVIPLRDATYNLGTLAGLGVTASLAVPILAWTALAIGGAVSWPGNRATS